tara:strand:- start:5742 stop:6779 length:1038 start_codon:yes stop_codon:yes gene_type:complete
MIIFNKYNTLPSCRIVSMFLFFNYLFLCSSAYSQTQIKIATLAPQNSDWAERFNAGSKEISERTDGRVRLKFYWGGAQGGAKKNLQKIKIGQLQGGTFSPTDFQTNYPDLNIYGLPFLFKDIKEVEHIRSHIDSELELGFKNLGFDIYGFAGGGFAYIMSNEPIRNYNDLTDKKIWLPQGDLISYEAMKALNLLPVPLPMTDVLTGLQTGLIDIVAIPPVVALALQWHTKVNYITKIPVLYAMGFLAIDSRVIKRLRPDDEAILDDVLTQIYKDVDQMGESDTNNAIQALLNIGLTEVSFDEIEYEKLSKLLIAPNQEMADRGMFSKDLYERIFSNIQDFRIKNK